jgi:dienelactone hydrolase
MPFLVTLLLTLVATPQAQAPAPPSEADARAHAAAIVSAMVAKDYAAVEGQFDDTMKAALPPGRFGGGLTTLAVQAGALQQCGENVRVRAIAGKQMVIQTCEFERAKLDFQVAFDAASRISGIAFRPVSSAAPYAPPPYATPSSYVTSEVTVVSGDWALPGTLTLPNAAGPFPAVVLVHGSGPNDRDETIGPNKPFADLAAGLASRGVAVLRYDKRTHVYGARMAALAAMTVKEETIDDALAAVALLGAHARIDPTRIFVLGHSLGGMLVPRIAAADPKLAGVIVMAGAARPLEDAIVEQTKYIANGDGTVTPAEQQQIDAMTTLAAEIRAVTPADAAAGKRIMNAPASYWLDLRGYDAPAAAKALTQPMLILQGERDYQVTMDEFARWKAALAGRSNVTFHSYPALNHLFEPGTGRSLPAEYERPSHVAEQVVVDIAAWIARRE